MTTSSRRLLLCLAASLATGCASVGPFVWVEDSTSGRQRSDVDVVIAPGDVLGVRISGQDALSTRVTVRADGKISLPLVNDQLAVGISPATLGLLLNAQYKTFINNPVVTVVLEERHAEWVSVVGAVTTPGTYQLTRDAGVLQAIALGGGLTPFAHHDRIFVLRRDGEGRPQLRIRFRYRSLLEAEHRSATFDLRGGDVVVVE
jgi:polysaccharide export outer membrane protein